MAGPSTVYEDILEELAAQHRFRHLNIPLVLGPVGTGKTSLFDKAANHRGLGLIDINCGENSDAVELTGFPLPSPKTMGEGIKYAEWVLNRLAARACAEPVLLFFDDIDKAKPVIQAALLAAFGKRKFRDYGFHPDTLIGCAGNRVEDDIAANRLTESIITRVTPIYLEPNINDFLAWGSEEINGEPRIHEVIRGFLSYSPEHLHKHHPDTMLRFPTPRGWEEASKQISCAEESRWPRIVERKAGTTTGSDFMLWYEIVRAVDTETLLYRAGSVGDSHVDHYAAAYACSSYLNRNGYEFGMTLYSFLEQLNPDTRIAFGMFLRDDVNEKIVKTAPETAALLLDGLM